MAAPPLPPALSIVPRIVRRDDIPSGNGRRLLLIVAHADDPAFFAGGIIALWTDAGWDVVCLRVTDDAFDSVALPPAETVARNTAEFARAATTLGISGTEGLGWPTDTLGDISRVALRERIIHAIRRLRPYGLVTFDPDSMFGEDNLDHRVLAQAVDEASWCAQFDKHHPEHLHEGLALHGVYERWYFGRSVVQVTHVFDISESIERQIDAVLCHPTMLRNILHQRSLQMATAGVAAPTTDPDDPAALRRLVETQMRTAAAAKGAPYGLRSAETMRLARIHFDDAPLGAAGD